MSDSCVLLWAAAIAKEEEATNKSNILLVILVFICILLWCSDEDIVDWKLRLKVNFRFECVETSVTLSSKKELDVHISTWKIWFSMRLRQTIIWKVRKVYPLPWPQWKLHPCMPVEVLAAWSTWFCFSSCKWQVDRFVSHSIMNSAPMTSACENLGGDPPLQGNGS